jgi:outer membrane protein assembly factor BamB
MWNPAVRLVGAANLQWGVVALVAALASAAALAGPERPAGKIAVTTYHYDNLRTGWNPSETSLVPSTVASAQFKLIAAVPLDEQVDAQPLLVPDQPISGHGTHDTVYVATESNTVYAIDAASGAILLEKNLGPPVPQAALPGQCDNNAPNIGITGTPVIDPTSGTLYVIAYTYRQQKQVYHLHALDLSTLADKISPVVVTATGTLSDGSPYKFNAAVSRQRAALLLANGNVYAGFASFCDEAGDQSRGWVLGWNASSLAPLASNHLDNRLAQSPDDFFLTSIWMSGYGLAASESGDVYFVTGNADYSGTTYDRHLNLSESVVQLSSTLKKVRSSFTPRGKTAGWQVLDQYDIDFGSGGAMLLPPQAGQLSNYLVAAGKAGIIYLLNADDLTNGRHGNNSILNFHNMGECWCGPTYFTGADGIGRVVTSGGSAGGVWKVVTGANPRLDGDFPLPAIATGQDPGFFTSVSSNGTQARSAVIWAVSRPVSDSDTSVSLYAFDGSDGTQLTSQTAGGWANVGGNSNIVPVAANGRVYVATNKSLAIFGLSGGSPARLPASSFAPAPRAELAPGEHEIYGTLVRIDGTLLTVRKRDGKTIVVDFAEAQRRFRMAEPTVGHALLARGTFDKGGILLAHALQHAKNHPALWPADR